MTELWMLSFSHNKHEYSFNQNHDILFQVDGSSKVCPCVIGARRWKKAEFSFSTVGSQEIKPINNKPKIAI